MAAQNSLWSYNILEILINDTKSRLQTSCSKCFLGDDIIELFFRDQSVVIGIGSFDHFLEFRIVDSLSQFLSHSSQVFDWNETSLLIVKKVEDFSDVFTTILIRDPCRHQFKELLEVDLTRTVGVQISDHLIDGLVFRLEAEWCHGGLEF